MVLCASQLWPIIIAKYLIHFSVIVIILRAIYHFAMNCIQMLYRKHKLKCYTAIMPTNLHVKFVVRRIEHAINTSLYYMLPVVS